MDLHEITGKEIVEILRLFAPPEIRQSLSLDDPTIAKDLANQLDIKPETPEQQLEYYQLVAWAVFYPYQKILLNNTALAANSAMNYVGSLHLPPIVILNLLELARADTQYQKDLAAKLARTLKAKHAADKKHEVNNKRKKELFDDYDNNYRGNSSNRNQAAKILAKKYHFDEKVVRQWLINR